MTVPDEVEKQVLDKAKYVEEAVSGLAAKQSLDEEEYRAPRLIDRKCVTRGGIRPALQS